MHLVFLGAPGAGKGTQAKVVSSLWNVPHVSTGDIFRAAIKEGTPVGREAKGYLDRGELVPDAVVCGIVRERLARPDCRSGFILDGFPRTVPQAEALETALVELGLPLKAAVNFTIDRAVLVARLSARVTCKACGSVFNTESNPPKVAGRCDACGGETYVRDDDRPETVARRLEEYDRKTAPLESWYRSKGIFHEVDASGAVSDVTAALRGVVGG